MCVLLHMHPGRPHLLQCYNPFCHGLSPVAQLRCSLPQLPAFAMHGVLRLGQAVALAEEEGLYHCDPKHDNIMLDAEVRGLQMRLNLIVMDYSGCRAPAEFAQLNSGAGLGSGTEGW